MFNTNLLIIWLLFSSIGMWYFIYWKKDQNYIALTSWIILMIFPYFITNIYYLIILWIIFLIIPFIIKW